MRFGLPPEQSPPSATTPLCPCPAQPTPGDPHVESDAPDGCAVAGAPHAAPATTSESLDPILPGEEGASCSTGRGRGAPVRSATLRRSPRSSGAASTTAPSAPRERKRKQRRQACSSSPCQQRIRTTGEDEPPPSRAPPPSASPPSPAPLSQPPPAPPEAPAACNGGKRRCVDGSAGGPNAARRASLSKCFSRAVDFACSLMPRKGGPTPATISRPECVTRRYGTPRARDAAPAPMQQQCEEPTVDLAVPATPLAQPTLHATSARAASVVHSAAHFPPPPLQPSPPPPTDEVISPQPRCAPRPPHTLQPCGELDSCPDTIAHARTPAPVYAPHAPDLREQDQPRESAPAILREQYVQDSTHTLAPPASAAPDQPRTPRFRTLQDLVAPAESASTARPLPQHHAAASAGTPPLTPPPSSPQSDPRAMPPMRQHTPQQVGTGASGAAGERVLPPPHATMPAPAVLPVPTLQAAANAGQPPPARYPPPPAQRAPPTVSRSQLQRILNATPPPPHAQATRSNDSARPMRATASGVVAQSAPASGAACISQAAAARGDAAVHTGRPTPPSHPPPPLHGPPASARRPVIHHAGGPHARALATGAPGMNLPPPPPNATPAVPAQRANGRCPPPHGQPSQPPSNAPPVFSPGRGHATPSSPPRGRGRGTDARAGLRRAAAQPQPPPRASPRTRADVPQQVPQHARAAWGRLVADTLENIIDAAASASGPQAAELLDRKINALADLPRRTLADGGASKGRDRRVLARIERVSAGLPLEDEGDAADTGAGAASAPTHGTRLSEDQRLAARIQRHLNDYSISRGARALASAPLADARSPAVIAALRAKHPAAEPPPPLRVDTPALQVDAETFDRALERLKSKRGAAGGPTEWRYEHILAATQTSEAARVAALGFVNLILSGELPRHSSLLDSSLIGLQKPDGGVRPIAVGEVWYRLAGLCALTACSDAGKALAPLQLGVGVSGGVEAVGHAVKAALAADPEAALLTVDMENAFNSIDLPAVMTEVKKRLPALGPVIDWSYGAPTNLHIVGAPEGTPPVQSRTGLRQGDVLAMLLFGLGLQTSLERTRDAAPDVVVVALADDVNLVGRPDALRGAFLTLQGPRGAGGIGLRVQPRKCAVTAGTHHAAAQLAADLGIQHCPEGVTVCGTPIGSDAYVADMLRRRADDVISQVDKLMRLPLALQSQFALLRASLSQRMAHLMRTVLWPQLQADTSRVEQAILGAVAAIFRLPTPGVAANATTASDRALEQMKLPLRHGGFGLRSVSALEADAALVSAAAKAQAAVATGPEACHPFTGAARPPLLAAWHRVFDNVADACEWDPPARELPAAFVRDALPHVQSCVSRIIGDRAGAAFLASCDTSTDAGRQSAARMRSAANGPASAWITALPGTPTTRMANAPFLLAGRHLLGMGPSAQLQPPPCHCSAGGSRAPDHAMSCKHNAGVITMRHNTWTSVWRRIIRRAGCATSMEPSYSHLATAPSGRDAAGQRRGDILAVMPDGRIVVLDCVITHPAAASYVVEASRTTGSAARRAERRKQQNFEAFGNGSAFEFVPLAVESYGRLGQAASRFLSELGAVAALDGRVSKAAFVRFARQELSCTLCKGNAGVYASSLFSIAQSAGRNFQPGCAVPMEDADSL